MRKLLIAAGLLLQTVCLNASTTWNLGGSVFTVDTLYHATVGPGVTQTQLKVKNSSYSNNLIYTTIDLTTPNLELRGVQAKDNGNVVENVRAMGDRKNQQGKGQYITGVNADFFNMGGSPTRTCGTSLVDGHLYNLGTAVAGWSSYAVVSGKKDLTFSENVSISYNAVTASGKSHRLWVDCGRGTNYLCIYTSNFGKTTGTNGWGSECSVKLVSGSLNDGSAVFEVTSTPIGNQGGTAAEGNMTIPSGGYVLSGVNDAFSYVKSLKIGDRITVSMVAIVDGKEMKPSQIVGGCPVIVSNGQVAPSSNFGRIDHFSSRQARTAIGYNKDKTKLIMLVDDKFTSNKDSSKPQFGASAGFTMKMMAYVMMQLDCHTAMAFDGGGSSQLYVKGLGICNVPYGSTALRSVANGFFAVSTTPVDNTVAKIEVVQKNVKLTTGGKITPKVYGYNKYGVMVNTNLTGFKIELSSKVGTVSGTTITAGSGKYNTKAIITYGSARYEMPLTVNGGGTFVSSEPVVIPPAPQITYTLTEMSSGIDAGLNDGWDATAPDWSNRLAVKSKACPRFATATAGKFYTVNMKTMSIMEIDADGHRDLYRLPALNGKINGVDDYYGTAISRDDAGNFLIGHYFTKEMSSYVWTVYSPTTGKAKTITLPVASDIKLGRIDCVGRVIGDLTKDAYVFVAPAYLGDGGANQKVSMIHFAGNGDVDAVTASVQYSPVVYLASHNTTVCQPLHATIDELNAALKAGKPLCDAFVLYSKAAGQSQWSCSFYKFENGKLSENLAKSMTNWAGTNGFDTFTLGGKRYYVMNHQSSEDKGNTSPMDIAVYDENGTVVASWKNADYRSCYGYSSITARPLNDKNVDIYVYNCTYSATGYESGAVATARLRLSTDGNTGYPVSEDISLAKLWSIVDSSFDDGWDATAPDWSSSTAIKAKSCPRFATAHDGKIYTVNMKTMSIMEIDANGHRDVYRLPALDGQINGVDDYYGTAISRDDAGNFLIGHYFTKEMSSYVWTVYSPTTGKAKNITLPVASGMKMGRIDCVGRVSGDLTREARVYIAPASTADRKVTMVTFRGDGDVASVTASCEYSPEVAPLSASLSVCQPEDDGFVFYSKSAAASSLYRLSEGKMSANIASAWKNYAATNGFDCFVLDGKKYYVVNYLAATDNANSSPMDIAVLDENGRVLASWKNADYSSTYGYSSIVVEPVDEVSVDIYVYNCTLKLGSGDKGAIAAAKLRFAIGRSPEPTVRQGYSLAENWSTLDTSLDDGWDATAPDWSSSTAIKAKSCPRFATAHDGKIYTVNMKTMSIMALDADGHRDVYALPALDGQINGVDDYYGTAISRDDAGNFLIGHYFTKEMSSYVWTVYSPTTGKAKNITLPVAAGMKVGRIDCVGRVSGDLTREAYVYIAPASTADRKVTMVTFKGDGDIASVTASCGYSPEVYPLSASLSVCQPLGEYGDAFTFYSKSSAATSLYDVTSAGLSSNLAANWTNYASGNGFDVFELDGMRYFVVNYLANEDKDNTSPMNIAVINEDGDIVATWKNVAYSSCYGYSSIVAEAVSDKSARIYVYNCTYKLGNTTGGAVAAAMLTFTVGDVTTAQAKSVTDPGSGTSGIDDISVDVPAVYYNLQGVEIAKPRSGVYIVRRGNKVSKEIVK